MDDQAFDPCESDEIPSIADAQKNRSASTGTRTAPRKRFVLRDDTGFDEVPKRYRRFYRRWRGEGDELAPNEILCPVCKVVIRSARELRVGDQVYCMPCMSRLTVVEGPGGRLEGVTRYAA